MIRAVYQKRLPHVSIHEYRPGDDIFSQRSIRSVRCPATVSRYPSSQTNTLLLLRFSQVEGVVEGTAASRSKYRFGSVIEVFPKCRQSPLDCTLFAVSRFDDGTVENIPCAKGNAARPRYLLRPWNKISTSVGACSSRGRCLCLSLAARVSMTR